MKLKKGKIDIVPFMVAAVIAGLLIMWAFGEPIKKAFASATDPLLKKIGLEEGESEQQAVEQELLENAKKAFNELKNIIEQCRNGKDLKCGCGQMNFEQLNKYSIVLSSNNKDTKNSFLQLLDSSGLPVKVGNPPIDPTPIVNFPTMPKNIYDDSDKFNGYKNNNNQLIFSLKDVRYFIPGKEDQHFSWNMKSIHFSKPVLGATIFNDQTIQTCSDKCPAFTFCSVYGKDSCNDCAVAKESCQWTDFDGSDDECINPYESSILHIKIDPGDNPTETWNFHLTNNPGHDGKNGFSPSYCNVYATNEEGISFSNPAGTDDISIWHINPGGRIVRTMSPFIGTIFKGLDGYVADVSDDNKASPYDTSGKETIGGELYTLYKNTKCTNNDPECRSFLRNPDSGNNYHYWPKYGLICDNDKKWKACHEKAKGQQKTIGSNTYECAEETYFAITSNIYYYTWKII